LTLQALPLRNLNPAMKRADLHSAGVAASAGDDTDRVLAAFDQFTRNGGTGAHTPL
jgi:hypothetical protein